MVRPARLGQLLHFTAGRLALVTDARPKAQGRSAGGAGLKPTGGNTEGPEYAHHLPTGSKAHSGWCRPLRRSDTHLVLRKYLLKNRVNAQKHRYVDGVFVHPGHWTPPAQVWALSAPPKARCNGFRTPTWLQNLFLFPRHTGRPGAGMGRPVSHVVSLLPTRGSHPCPHTTDRHTLEPAEIVLTAPHQQSPLTVQPTCCPNDPQGPKHKHRQWPAVSGRGWHIVNSGDQAEQRLRDKGTATRRERTGHLTKMKRG